jgi:hypothetical protein
MSDEDRGGWLTVGAVGPTKLVEARVQAHWAVQLIASIGQAFVEPRADDSHRAMVWTADNDFLGDPTRPEPSLRVRVRLQGLTVRLEAEDATWDDTLALDGKTLEDAYKWVGERISEHGGDAEGKLTLPDFEIPYHAVVDGAAFSAADGPSFVEVKRWFHNANVMLRRIARGHEGASGIRVWPHHFDIGFLIVIDPDVDSEGGRTVGVGLSPGDKEIPEPYWYVNVWPRPEPGDLPGLDGAGQWNMEGWFGAYLRGTDQLAGGDPRAQEAQVKGFLDSAVAGAKHLLGATPAEDCTTHQPLISPV